MDPLPTLQARWTELYSHTLPALARGRDPAQPRWPVTLDHCFARIILDNTVGEGREQWDRRLQKPAVRNMSRAQLVTAIELGERVARGEVDLVALDLQSLEARGKGGGKYKGKEQKLLPGAVAEMEVEVEVKRSKIFSDAAVVQKRKRAEDDDETATPPSKLPRQDASLSKKHQSTLPFTSSTRSQSSHLPSPPASDITTTISIPALQPLLHKISTHPTLSPYRKRLYATLLSVPRGRYTTYAALSTFLHSSARAVGSGMRHNPFAPDVPCHRVLAADGSIGGFGGSWGKEGEHAGEKVRLLRGEGVRFDGRGRVVGVVFREFLDLMNEIPP